MRSRAEAAEDSSSSFKDVIAWVKDKSGSPAEIDWDLDLIESRTIDSLHFLDLICALEDTSGRTIDLDLISVDDLRTLRKMREVFFS